MIWGDRFAEAIIATIEGLRLKAIARKRPFGNIDLITDNTDLLEDPTRRRALARLFD